MKFKRDGNTIRILTYETAIPLQVPSKEGLNAMSERIQDKMFDDLFDAAPPEPDSDKELIRLAEEKKEILNAALNTSEQPSPIDDFDFLNPTSAPQHVAPQDEENTPLRHTPEVKETLHKISIEELFQRHLNNKSPKDAINIAKDQQNEEQILFSKLDMNNTDDRNLWAKHLFQLSNLAEEAKNRFAKASQLSRESDAKNKVTIWDRERRGTNALNGSLRLVDPRRAKELNDEESKERSKAKRKAATKFNKFELSIRLGLELGEDAASLIDQNKGKYTEKQVMEAIDKVQNEGE